ncbi:hypothetical protein P8452_13311 [Trifolium repens]|nr:hypothetical protein P8452_13311 [Trifolium repens]
MDLSRNMADAQQDRNKSKEANKRHSPLQTSRLEEIFMTVEHPTTDQISDIAKEIGLQPRQVKFWFQNRRTQKKCKTEKTVRNVFLAENERLKNENIQMKEQLKNILCTTCGRRFCKNHSVEQLMLENARLREEVS